MDSASAGIGRLQVSVLLPGVIKPATDAVVRVTAADDEKNVIEQMITDQSGQTPVLNLPAPPPDYSMHPGGPRPFSTYDVYIDTAEYQPAVIKGVQIFPNTTALQNIELTQKTYAGQPPRQITVDYPALYGDFPPKIPEAMVKPLPSPESGFVLLPEPVIPEFIIVHDGHPNNAAAPNYTVPFIDYIKNVTSSEIYATWPENTIRANVLAIISFTLNRVFTEWYRSRGFHFTITSSTAVDQKFIYGRNIFEEISVIVDAVFNTYITMPNIRQPLLAQYCDGRRVTCPGWMSQWGSKDLGVRGYNTIDILRRFYGPQIHLEQAEQVQGIPTSWPGNVLQVGSSGPDVRAIQERLNGISNNFPAINRVRADGVYGEQTRESVETFQRVFHLPATGIVDFATWFKITRIYVGVTRMAELT